LDLVLQLIHQVHQQFLLLEFVLPVQRLKMVDKNRILIYYYRDGKSKRRISQELKISRKTVRKYISEHEQLYAGEEIS